MAGNSGHHPGHCRIAVRARPRRWDVRLLGAPCQWFEAAGEGYAPPCEIGRHQPLGRPLGHGPAAVQEILHFAALGAADDSHRPSQGVDACPPFPGGPRRGGGRLESLGSIQAHPLADDLGCRWLHADIVVVPLVALCQVAVHILEQVRFLWVRCGPLDRLPVLDLGASVFNRVGRGLRCVTAVFSQHREGAGWVLGVPRSPVESPFRRGAGVPRNCGRVLVCGAFEVRV